MVTETGSADQATQSAGHIWTELSRRYGPSLVLLEHHLAPQAAQGAETVDLVRIGADGSPHWLRIWPTQQEHPSHAGLELWMATYGHQIAGQPGQLVRPVRGRERLMAIYRVPARTWRCVRLKRHQLALWSASNAVRKPGKIAVCYLQVTNCPLT